MKAEKIIPKREEKLWFSQRVVPEGWWYFLNAALSAATFLREGNPARTLKCYGITDTAIRSSVGYCGKSLISIRMLSECLQFRVQLNFTKIAKKGHSVLAHNRNFAH